MALGETGVWHGRSLYERLEQFSSRVQPNCDLERRSSQICYPWFATISNAVFNGAQITIPYDSPISCSAIPWGDPPPPRFVLYGAYPYSNVALT